jgi:DNA-binding transcriptional LysR family regulator
MDLETLELFVEVMRRGSFADVARARGVAPSSISRAIATLENELGIRLFQRSTRKLEPTEAAMVYFGRINPVVNEIETARQLALDVTEELKGTLRVTTGTVFGQTAIVPIIPELAKTHPQLSIELQLTDAYLDLVEERIDVAIRLGSLKDSSYIAKRLANMEFHVCASPDYIRRCGIPQKPEDIENHDCLVFPRTGYSVDWLFKDSRGGIKHIPIKGKYLITNSQAIKQCAITGMGLTLLPDWLINDALASGELVSMFSEYVVTATDFENAIWILYPSREYMPLKSRVFVDYLQLKFGQS